MNTNDQVTALTDEFIDNACYGIGFNDFSCAVEYDRAIVRKVFSALAKERAATQPAGRVVTGNYSDADKTTLAFMGIGVAAPISEDTAKGFPERDQSKPAEQQGMFHKFAVCRTDGSSAPGGKHHGCRYFVLDLDHDAHAASAMRAYAESCRHSHPRLAADIDKEFPPMPTARPPASLGSEAKGEAVGSIRHDANFRALLDYYIVGAATTEQLFQYIDSRIAAAPERSGKTADVQPVACEIDMDGTHCDKAGCVVANCPATVPIAGNSSAAPSEVEILRRKNAGLESMLTVAINERNALLAAPAPTGESRQVEDAEMGGFITLPEVSEMPK